jgi:RNA polymerase sigma factor (sigma-70 family)
MGVAAKQAPAPPESQWSDPRLVKECLEGNEAAWSALVDKYKNLIFSIPLRYGFSREDAADIFQAVCMDLLVELPKVREPNALGGWLIQVTRNKCFHRKQEQSRQPVMEIDEETQGDAGEKMESVIAQVQEEQLLRDAIGELSPRCQELVRLLFFESPARPYQEVADGLGLATGSIGLIRRRCLEKLRRLLEEQGVQPRPE